MPATEQLPLSFFTPPTPTERLSHHADQPLRPRCRQKGLIGTMFAPQSKLTPEPAVEVTPAIVVGETVAAVRMIALLAVVAGLP